MKSLSIFPLLLLSIFVFTSNVQAKKSKLPAWLKPLIDIPMTDEDVEAQASVLLDWTNIDYSKKGLEVTSFRYAVKLLTWDEIDNAIARVYFNENGDRINVFNAWIIQEDGTIEDYSKKDAITMATNLDSLFSESKVMIHDLDRAFRPGCIFAYESKATSKTVFPQSLQYLNQTIPKKHFVFEIKVPKNWEAQFFEMNGPEGGLTQEGNLYRWEAKNLRYWESETNGPSSELMTGMLGTNIYPLDNKNKRNKYISFNSWNEVAAFGDLKNTSMAISDTGIKNKTLSLTSGSTTDWEKIKQIANYVQDVNYLSISQGLNWGGGYQPRQASEIFRLNYGDCKDMTALTRAMLKVVGIESYAVLANIDENAVVHENWPSPKQFDHCIVAIKVDDSLDKPAVVKHPELGSLLYFDPTLYDSPIGYLPKYISNSYVLVADKSISTPQKLPPNNILNNFQKRSINVTLNSQGSLTGEIIKYSTGSVAWEERRLLNKRTNKEYKDSLKSWIANNTNNAQILDVQVKDQFDEAAIEIKIKFKAPNYAKSMRGRFMMFKPVILSRYKWTPEENLERKTDFVIPPSLFDQTITFTLPKNYSVEEVSKDTIIECKYGNYKLTSEEKGGKLIIKRSLQINQITVPPEEYEDLVKFFTLIVKADQTPVLLIKD